MWTKEPQPITDLSTYKLENGRFVQFRIESDTLSGNASAHRHCYQCLNEILGSFVGRLEESVTLFLETDPKAFRMKVRLAISDSADVDFKCLQETLFRELDEIFLGRQDGDVMSLTMKPERIQAD